MITPLINKLKFDGMSEYSYKVLLGIYNDINNTDHNTKYYLRNLSEIYKNLPYKDPQHTSRTLH